MGTPILSTLLPRSLGQQDADISVLGLFLLHRLGHTVVDTSILGTFMSHTGHVYVSSPRSHCRRHFHTGHDYMSHRLGHPTFCFCFCRDPQSRMFLPPFDTNVRKEGAKGGREGRRGQAKNYF